MEEQAHLVKHFLKKVMARLIGWSDRHKPQVGPKGDSRDRHSGRNSARSRLRRGELLAALVEEKGVSGQGIEIDDDAILQCVACGLNVFHDDIDRGLSEYGDGSFDFVILNQTFQQVKKPDEVLKEACAWEGR